MGEFVDHDEIAVTINSGGNPGVGKSDALVIALEEWLTLVLWGV